MFGTAAPKTGAVRSVPAAPGWEGIGQPFQVEAL